MVLVHRKLSAPLASVITAGTWSEQENVCACQMVGRMNIEIRATEENAITSNHTVGYVFLSVRLTLILRNFMQKLMDDFFFFFTEVGLQSR